MKKILICMMMVLFLVVSAVAIMPKVCAETIYTKDGEEIKAEISEITDGTVWYETTVGDVVECTGIDMVDIEKIENDDGTVYGIS